MINFLYIGTAKTASTWLFECLREHPECFVPDAKDLMYFNKEFSRGSDWYLSHFKAVKPSHQAIGELSHDYYLLPETILRIKNFNPKIKIVILLRDPFDRSVSHYNYDLSIGRWQGSLNSYISNKNTIAYNNYLENLEIVFNTFPREQIWIEFYENIQRSPEEILRSLYTFLSIDHSFTPSCLHTKILSGQKFRLPIGSSFINLVAESLRKMGKPNYLGKLKHSELINKILFKKNSYSGDLSLRNDFITQHKDKYLMLETLLQKKVPDTWFNSK